jgi:hypothetical protein
MTSMLTLSFASRFSFRCPSSIAACFSASMIFDIGLVSNFQISCLASFPR